MAQGKAEILSIIDRYAMGILDFFKPNVENLKAKKDVEGLINVLGRKRDSDMRRQAAKALGEIGDAKVIEPLIQALTDDDVGIQSACCDALAKMDANTVNAALATQAFKVGKDTPKQWKMITDFLAERVGADKAVNLVKQENIKHIISSIRDPLFGWGISAFALEMGHPQFSRSPETLKRDWEQIAKTINLILESDDHEFREAAIEGLIRGLGSFKGERTRQLVLDMTLRDIPRLGMSRSELSQRCAW